MTDKRRMKKMLCRASPETTEHTINGHMAMNTMNEHMIKKRRKIRNPTNKNLMKEKSESLLEFIVVSCSRTHNKLIVCIAGASVRVRARERRKKILKPHSVASATSKPKQDTSKWRRNNKKKRAQTEYAWSRSTTINEFQMKHKWNYIPIRRRWRRRWRRRQCLQCICVFGSAQNKANRCDEY